MDLLTISKSFTAVGAGQSLRVAHGKKFSYALSGTFSATLVLERSYDNFQSIETVVSGLTGAASGTLLHEHPAGQAAQYRFRCAAFTSGTAVTSLTEVATVSQEVKDANGNVLFQITEEGVSTMVRKRQRIVIPAPGLAKVGGTAGFSVAPTDNTSLVTCPASQTGSNLVIPVFGLKVGMKITAFNLVGQVESGGNAVVIDADLRKHTAAAADVADASVGAMTQLSVTADTILAKANTEKSGLSEVVGEDETFYILVTATTLGSTDIALQGAVVEVEEA